MTVRPLDAMTYVPSEDEARQLERDLAAIFPADEQRRPEIVVPELGTLALPEPVMDLVVQVIRAVAAGEGISVIPRHQLLTTQESADVLGISRPTLVRLLESGEIPFSKRGRHRRVRLDDLIDYQERSRKERSDALDRMVAVGEASEMYDATTGLPPRTR